MKPHYRYRAIVRRVVDGDTIDVDIDLGLRIWSHRQRLRLYGLDAPEVRGAERPAGLASKEFLRGLIDGQPVVVDTHKDTTGKYGRWLATVWRENTPDSWVNVNRELVSAGHARSTE